MMPTENHCTDSRRAQPGRSLLAAECLCAVAILLMLVAPAVAEETAAMESDESLAPAPGTTVTVEATFDGRPFTYRVHSVEDKGSYQVWGISYPSPVTTRHEPNNTVPAEYFVPSGIRPGDQPRPAVICLHILDGGMELVEIMGSALASRGIPAIAFKMPYYGERGFPGGPETLAANPSLFVDALGQTMEDIRRTIDLLASRPEVADDKIAVAGISLGGIVAASAAQREPRLYKAALILAGGNLPTIIDSAAETDILRQTLKGLPPEEYDHVLEAIREMDPLNLADRLRNRATAGNILMINAAEDEVIPRECTEELAEALGITDQVQWLPGLGHYTAMAALPQVLEQTIRFFAVDLPPGVAHGTAPSVPKTPSAKVARVLQQATRFWYQEPDERRCHMLRIRVEGVAQMYAAPTVQPTTPTPDTPERVEPAAVQKEPFSGSAMLIRGHGRQFRIEVELPELGTLTLGQSDRPWMRSRTGTVFVGRLDGDPKSPLAYADPSVALTLQTAMGAVAGATLTPQLLDRFAAFRDGGDRQGRPVVTARARDGVPAVLHFILSADGSRPERIEFEVGNVRGAIDAEVWQLNTAAHPQLFEPDGGPRHEVAAEDMYRMFGELLNFSAENLQ